MAELCLGCISVLREFENTKLYLVPIRTGHILFTKGRLCGLAFHDIDPVIQWILFKKLLLITQEGGTKVQWQVYFNNADGYFECIFEMQMCEGPFNRRRPQQRPIVTESTLYNLVRLTAQYHVLKKLVIC